MKYGIRKEVKLVPEKEEILLKISEIRGNSAYKEKGRVGGKVKIVFSARGLSKFQKGNILVTSMTTPDFVVAIEKAKAIVIVTDKGGIGCHAAVISREFKIPCIVGTEIVTKIL